MSTSACRMLQRYSGTGKTACTNTRLALDWYETHVNHNVKRFENLRYNFALFPDSTARDKRRHAEGRRAFHSGYIPMWSSILDAMQTSSKVRAKKVAEISNTDFVTITLICRRSATTPPSIPILPVQKIRSLFSILVPGYSKKAAT